MRACTLLLAAAAAVLALAGTARGLRFIPNTCICTTVMSIPVCGTDGKVYKSKCALNCAKVAEGFSCGGRADCQKDCILAYVQLRTPTKPDIIKPDVCSTAKCAFKPVCSVSGKVYSSVCSAACAKDNVRFPCDSLTTKCDAECQAAAKGQTTTPSPPASPPANTTACPEDAPDCNNKPDDNDGRRPGGMIGSGGGDSDSDSDSDTSKPQPAPGGKAGSKAACLKKCSSKAAPVCARNGVVYTNACQMKCHGQASKFVCGKYSAAGCRAPCKQRTLR